MVFKYDSNYNLKQPMINICTQDRRKVGIVRYTDPKIVPMYCDTSELSFTVYEDWTGYDKIRKNTVLFVENFGYWVVNDVTENDFGTHKIKEVAAYSYEVTLCRRSITLESDVYKLYDPLNDDHSLLGLIADQTNWNIGHVDSTLLNKRRTMEFDNVSVYDALMNDITETFKCFFVFDTTTMTISCYDQAKVPAKTGINLSFKNLVNELTTKTSSDDIVTALYVTGADGCDISMVNPLGNNMIYDFTYFYDEMTPELRQAVEAWAEMMETAEGEYMSLNATYLYYLEEIERKDVEIEQIDGEIKALKDAQSVAISEDNTTRLAELKPQLETKEASRGLLVGLRDSYITARDTAYADKVAFIQTCQLKNNLTEEQYETLQFFMQYGTYENQNFLFTSDMLTSEKFDWEDMLYRQAKEDFSKISRTKYNYELKLCNFITDKKYAKFVQSLELGKTVKLEWRKGIWIEPKILKVELDWTDPANTTIVLSDTFTIIDNVYKFSDDFTSTSKIANKVALSIGNWQDPVKKGFYDTVNNYINNALSLANQEIINADNQEFGIGTYGIRGRKVDTVNGGYEDKQVAIINNLIAFTDDGWATTKTALGEITVGQQKYYGLAAEAVLGRLVAADHLVISNTNNTFTVDGSGATLIDATLTVESGKRRILLDSTNGFKIQKQNEQDSTQWDDVFYADSNGNLEITGKLSAATGSNIAGWTTTATRFTAPSGDYIDCNGTGQLGLMTWGTNQGASWARFDGNIYANNLYSNYGGSQVFSWQGASGWQMGGGWLVDASIGKDKRIAAEWDALYADYAEFQQVKADAAYIADLEAGYITAGGVQTPIMFGGEYYVTKGSYYTKISTDDEYIDAQRPHVSSMSIEASGNINITPTLGQVKVVNSTNDAQIYTNKVNIVRLNDTGGDLIVGHDVEVYGTTKTDWLQVTNKINRCVVSDVFAVGGEHESSNPTGFFWGDCVMKGRLYINGQLSLDSTNQGDNGETQNVTVDGKTLHFKKGIFVGVW